MNRSLGRRPLLQGLKCILSVGVAFAPAACVHSPEPSSHPSQSPRTAYGRLRQIEREIASQAPHSGYKIGSEMCGPTKFPKVPIGLRKGYCAGLVASQEDGLLFPRSIVQLPGTTKFLVTDMGGFHAGAGRVLMLEPTSDGKYRLRTLLEKLDSPHGLQIGPDGKPYVGAIGEIFRFDPFSSHPRDTIEYIVRGLPGRSFKLSDGSQVEDNAHPLKHFIFAEDGSLYVNVGAPSDNCLTSKDRRPESKACAAGEGSYPNAAIWKFQAPKSKIFPALRPGMQSPAFEVYARGLRNSMAMVATPGFPAKGSYLLQAENSRDLSDPERPNEELNVIFKGKHYGWPYCFDQNTASPEYAAYLAKPGPYQDLCDNKALYQRPLSLLPPHAAPLSMIYYNGAKFPDLQGRLLMSFHGYMPSGSRIVAFPVNAKGIPLLSQEPLRYHVNCGAEPTLPIKTATSDSNRGTAYEELIRDWYRVDGVRPQGSPVAMTVASDGAIWVVEDKNQTILRIDADTNPAAEPETFACDARSNEEVKELFDFIDANPENRARLARLRTGFFESKCMGCHSDFGLRPEMTSDDQRDAAIARFLLSQEGWIYPGDLNSSKLHRRTHAIGAEREMPPGGLDLIQNDPEHRAMLDELDRFIMTLVPAQPMRIQLATSPVLRVRDRQGNTCGSVPAGTIVLVLDAKAAEKPGFARIYKPSSKYMTGCAGTRDFYVGAQFVVSP